MKQDLIQIRKNTALQILKKAEKDLSNLFDEEIELRMIFSEKSTVMNPEEMMDIIAKHFGTTVEEITVLKSRKRNAILAKRFTCYFCKKYYSMTVVKIGNLLNLDHSSVVVQLRNMETFLKVYDDYKIHYNALLKKI